MRHARRLPDAAIGDVRVAFGNKEDPRSVRAPMHFNAATCCIRMRAAPSSPAGGGAGRRGAAGRGRVRSVCALFGAIARLRPLRFSRFGCLRRPTGWSAPCEGRPTRCPYWTSSYACACAPAVRSLSSRVCCVIAPGRTDTQPALLGVNSPM